MNRKLVFDALLASYNHHISLGEQGKKIVSDQGDIVQNHLLADIESEKAMLNVVSASSYWGEEIGKNNGGGNGFWVFDGIDGTANYVNQGLWPYGAMLAGSFESNPKYDDFLVAGVGLFEEGIAVIAEKNNGVYTINFNDQKEIKLPGFDSNVQFDETKILSDNYYQEAKDILGVWQNTWPRTGSTAAAISAIVMRNIVEDKKYPLMNHGWQGLVDVTRKGNLEQPVLYLFLKELGGVMIDKNGTDIGSLFFKSWGQNSSEHLLVVSAAGQNIADKILSNLTLIK